ncbi:MAG: peptidoglycan-binding protein [Desulfobacteraceae bacterium]|nr:peptidoglycan-binding protein [Desulfobacteraceae bacterium]
MKVYQRIVPAFSFLIILACLTMPLYAVEKIAAEHKEESDKVLKFTDYNDLKGAELIRMVQLTLKDSGFDPGPIDGILGPKTREAIKRFQIKNELEPTGGIDEQTINQLFRSF